ncbi:MAG: hypothetical protein JO340_18960 [Acidobacteriaceae bacterium]|nr:hypothetical protein [Acidobacteriaceae bacterium]
MNVRNSTSARLAIAVAFSFLCGNRAFAQHVSAGVVAGGALTSDFTPLDIATTSYVEHSISKDYIVGGMLAVSIPWDFSLEADAMYRPMTFAGTIVLPSGAFTDRPSDVLTWEVPILLQYKFKPNALPLRPLLEIGPSFRASGNRNGTAPSSDGVTAGAGLEADVWKLKVAPQFRYTRWAADGAHPPLSPNTKPDQIELLVTVAF